MHFLLPTLLLSTLPPTGFTASVERLPVRVTGKGVTASAEVDALLGRVVLKGLTPAGKTRLCPTQKTVDGVVVLECTSRRLWAQLEHDARGVYIDVRQLTSINWTDRDSEIPMATWSLKDLSLPDTCPGTGPAARAECAWMAGDLGTAKRAWDEALGGPDVGLARLRLGDLALRSGDVEGAMKLYAAVTSAGPLGRLAAARTCELVGTCFSEAESARAANEDGLALPFAREMTLLTVRREVLSGRDRAAIVMLTAKLEADPRLCETAIAFCQKVIEAGLASSDVEARIAALSAFLNEALRHGPREIELSLAAAQTARELGAPGFAASVLAANTPRVARERLPAHLLLVVQLYLAANDRVRAGVIFEYAEGKLGPATRSAPWNQLRRQLGRPPRAAPPAPTLARDEAAFEALTSQVALTTDLARAAAARSRAADAPQENTP